MATSEQAGAARLRNSPAVLSIIAILAVVYVAQLRSSGVADRLSLPERADGLADRPWSPMTVMFVHEHPVHFAVMVLMLAAFGTRLEQLTRSLDVVAVYLVAGLTGSLAVLTAVTAAPALAEGGTLVGASAAVLGVTAAVFACRPSSRVYGGTGTQWLAVLVGINIALLFSSPLGSVAHLAGIAAGWTYTRWRTRLRPRVVQPL